jgi:3',5'-cyclic AMP phosphodiesterase CpdA
MTGECAIRIVHVSDIHYGRNDPHVMSAAREAIRAINPDLLVVSGDLTQRARRLQFEAAINWVDSLEVPERVIVPGNHDVPLDSPIERIFSPLARFKRYTGIDLPVVKSIRSAHIVGIATPRPIVMAPRFLTEGAVSEAQREQVAALMRSGGSTQPQGHAASPAGVPAIRIVVQHHPPVLAHHDYGTHAVPHIGAQRTLRAYEEAGVDLVLFGHLHRHEVQLSRDHQRADSLEGIGGRSIVCVMAGTLSTRLRDQPPGFVELVADGMPDTPRLRVVGHRLESDGFEVFATRSFVRNTSGWRVGE